MRVGLIAIRLKDFVYLFGQIISRWHMREQGMHRILVWHFFSFLSNKFTLFSLTVAICSPVYDVETVLTLPMFTAANGFWKSCLQIAVFRASFIFQTSCPEAVRLIQRRKNGMQILHLVSQSKINNANKIVLPKNDHKNNIRCAPWGKIALDTREG